MASEDNNSPLPCLDSDLSEPFDLRSPSAISNAISDDELFDTTLAEQIAQAIDPLLQGDPELWVGSAVEYDEKLDEWEAEKKRKREAVIEESREAMKRLKMNERLVKDEPATDAMEKEQRGAVGVSSKTYMGSAVDGTIGPVDMEVLEDVDLPSSPPVREQKLQATNRNLGPDMAHVLARTRSSKTLSRSHPMRLYYQELDEVMEEAALYNFNALAPRALRRRKFGMNDVETSADSETNLPSGYQFRKWLESLIKEVPRKSRGNPKPPPTSEDNVVTRSEMPRRDSTSPTHASYPFPTPLWRNMRQREPPSHSQDRIHSEYILHNDTIVALNNLLVVLRLSGPEDQQRLIRSLQKEMEKEGRKVNVSAPTAAKRGKKCECDSKEWCVAISNPLFPNYEDERLDRRSGLPFHRLPASCQRDGCGTRCPRVPTRKDRAAQIERLRRYQRAEEALEKLDSKGKGKVRVGVMPQGERARSDWVRMPPPLEGILDGGSGQQRWRDDEKGKGKRKRGDDIENLPDKRTRTTVPMLLTEPLPKSDPATLTALSSSEAQLTSIPALTTTTPVKTHAPPPPPSSTSALIPPSSPRPSPRTLATPRVRFKPLISPGPSTEPTENVLAHLERRHIARLRAKLEETPSSAHLVAPSTLTAGRTYVRSNGLIPTRTVRSYPGPGTPGFTRRLTTPPLPHPTPPGPPTSTALTRPTPNNNTNTTPRRPKKQHPRLEHWQRDPASFWTASARQALTVQASEWRRKGHGERGVGGHAVELGRSVVGSFARDAFVRLDDGERGDGNGDGNGNGNGEQGKEGEEAVEDQAGRVVQSRRTVGGLRLHGAAQEERVVGVEDGKGEEVGQYEHEVASVLSVREGAAQASSTEGSPSLEQQVLGSMESSASALDQQGDHTHARHETALEANVRRGTETAHDAEISAAANIGDGRAPGTDDDIESSKETSLTRRNSQLKRKPQRNWS